MTGSLGAVTARVEEFYQGANGPPGLFETETLLVSLQTIGEWSKRFKIGMITGRPRADVVVHGVPGGVHGAGLRVLTARIASRIVQ